MSSRPGVLVFSFSLFLLLLRVAMARLTYARYCVRIGVYFAAMALWGIAGAPVAFVLAATGRRFAVGRIITRSFYYVVGAALGLHVELEGAEHLTTQPAVLMLNHQSALDVWLLGSFLPHRSSTMVKKSLEWTPIGPTLYFSGALFVRRGTGARAVASVRSTGATLRDSGVSLMVFPEGTRSGARTPSLLPFKKGGFHMAVQSGLPIVPIVCENYSHMFRPGCFEPATLKVRVLPPISTTGLGAEDVTALTAQVQEQMLQAVLDISRRTAA
ncbi:1-acyl-sn-glycerol-3-phosphate-acyltransferase [Mycena maculata]|uniref:1-acyl-sn-glycerol-3-phosphate-acyltransferase n=1 Tax=Mycena maculata TaxID=230809 RepID=A0AAD7JEE0_9AGAR|nr:1-acyl-sn-glycerol-3-phosphate-acyltransferase [Mycena maculata]